VAGIVVAAGVTAGAAVDAEVGTGAALAPAFGALAAAGRAAAPRANGSFPSAGRCGRFGADAPPSFARGAPLRGLARPFPPDMRPL
jgi:hypothetical protein